MDDVPLASFAHREEPVHRELQRFPRLKSDHRGTFGPEQGILLWRVIGIYPAEISDRPQQISMSCSTGTEGSNPAPSSGEMVWTGDEEMAPSSL
jgi:hypothetical protein